jgi:hypothetical protein
MRRMRASKLLGLLAVATLVLAGCTGGVDGDSPAPSGSSDGLPTGDPKDQSTDVAFAPCGTGFPCMGEIDGIPYEIALPETWNGSLLIYSRPLVPIDAAQPENKAFAPIAETAPGTGAGVEVVADALLDQGYALAGAGTPTGGWAIDEAIASISTVREAFVTNVGVPNRIYTWGQSLGGLAALRAGQDNGWVSGSASICGLLAGLNPNMDLALDAAVAVKALLAPKLKLTGFESVDEARAEYERAMGKLIEAAQEPFGAGVAPLQAIAQVAEVPNQSATTSGITPEAISAAIVENLEPVMARTTLQRFRIEQELGGNPSTNAGVNYGARVTVEEAAAIDAYGGEGTTLALLRQVAALPPVEADAAARAEADEQYPRPTALAKPALTLHTALDPVAILANETLYGTWAAEASGQDIRWLSINVAAPPTEPQPAGQAPTGVGHCNFTGATLVGAVKVLDEWVRLGRFPTWAGNATAFGEGAGFTGPYQLPLWPQSPTTQEMAASASASPRPSGSASPGSSPSTP